LSRPRLVVLLALALAAISVAAAGASSGRTAGKTLTIGISLSLSGDFSDSGKAAMRGYQLWRDVVNAHGGLMGQHVNLKILDDTSSPTQVVTNYQTLITKNKVAFVFGPFSTLLTAPAATVANRYHYAFIEPAGGGPAVFGEKLHNVFFTQPAPIVNSADVFAHYILSLPKSLRPKTAAYPSLDDPFASPIADRVRSLLQKAGIKTVYKTIYPAETTDLTPIVSKYAAKKPDLVVGGTQNDDAYAQVKAMVQLKFSPKFLFLSNGPNDPAEFPSKVGRKNIDGIFSTGDWFPDSKAPGNKAFVKAYVRRKRRLDRSDLGGSLRSRPGAAARSGQDPFTRQREDHLGPPQGEMADGRGRPALEQHWRAAGKRSARRVDTRKAVSGVSEAHRAALAYGPEAALG